MAKIVNEYVLNGDQHIVTVAIPVFHLAKFEDSDIIISPSVSMDVTLAYEECSVSELPFTPLSIPSSDLDMDISQLVVNPDVVAKELGKSNVNNIAEVTPLATPYYVILTPSKLKDSFTDLVNWKRQKGYDVIVKTVEEVTSDPQYEAFDNGEIQDVAFDKESYVRNWLKSLYFSENLGPFHLLIAGDYRTSAPIRKFRDVKGNSKEWYEWYDGENFIPTDSYFSDLTSNFVIDNIADGHYYGFLSDQKTFSPLLPTGRLLAYEPKHISTYTNKLLIYELDPGLGDRSYLDKVLVSRQHQHRNYPSLLGHLRNFKDSILLTDQTSVDNFAESRPVGKDVIDAMKLCGLVSMQGHGSPVTIACSGKSNYQHYRYIQAMTAYDIDNDIRHTYTDPENALDILNNRAKPGIFYTLSCTVTPFDNINFPENGYRHVPYDMGSGYTVAGDFGGVAFIGNTRTGWDRFNKQMELDFGRRIKEGYDLGYSVNLSNSSINYRYSQYARNLIGDPDIKIWYGAPNESHLNCAYNGGILSLNGENLKESIISLSNGAGLSRRFRANSSSISINASSLGFNITEPIVVTAFKEGFLPDVKILATNSTVSESNRSFFSKSFNFDSDFSNGDYSFIIITNNGVVNFRGTEDFISNGGFYIGNEGKLNVKSLGTVCMTGDVVSEGAALDIEARNLELRNGFCVERGGEFTFTPK